MLSGLYTNEVNPAPSSEYADVVLPPADTSLIHVPHSTHEVVREIDALGGEMGKNIDKTYIQMKMLNTGKAINNSFLPGCPAINAYATFRLRNLSHPSPGILFNIEHFK